MVMREYFNVWGGNSGLTESVIYWNPPKAEERNIVVYSGATLGTTLMGNIDIDTILKNKPIKIFTAPAIVIARKGLAGRTKYIENGSFTINDDAYVIKVKEKYSEEIDLKWVDKIIHKYAYSCITSREANGTFAKEQFLNLEFSFPPIKEQKEMVDRYNSIDSLKDKVSKILVNIEQINEYVVYGVIELKKEAGILFDLTGGNSGLTEEFIYNNQPINEEDSVKIYSSSTNETTNMGFVSKNAKIKGKRIITFKGPAIIIARNGQAGKVIFVENGIFTVNDHAYVLTVNSSYKKTIELEWVANVLEKYTMKCVTSKDSNGTFNKEIFLREQIEVPDYTTQKEIVKYKKSLNALYTKLIQFTKAIEENTYT